MATRANRHARDRSDLFGATQGQGRWTVFLLAAEATQGALFRVESTTYSWCGDRCESGSGFWLLLLLTVELEALPAQV